jgi:hypothetical protein
MNQLTTWQQLGLAALLNAAIMVGPAYLADAQDVPSADTPAAANAAAPNLALAVSPPGAVPQTTVRPVLDNPAQPGDAFPTDPWASNE